MIHPHNNKSTEKSSERMSGYQCFKVLGDFKISTYELVYYNQYLIIPVILI